MNVYEQADSRVSDFLAWLSRSFANIRKKTTRQTNTTALFDELNVLYQQINVYSRGLYLSILQEAYDAEVEKKWRRFTEDFLIVILDEPNEYTTVTFSNELERKAERFAEQITAAIARTLQNEERTNENGVKIPLDAELKKLFDREFNSLALLLDQYSIDTVDRARTEAFIDDGVRRVRWVTVMDGNECAYCRKLNGHVFPVDRVPTKPHPRCRCYTIRFD